MQVSRAKLPIVLAGFLHVEAPPLRHIMTNLQGEGLLPTDKGKKTKATSRDAALLLGVRLAGDRQVHAPKTARALELLRNSEDLDYRDIRLGEIEWHWVLADEDTNPIEALCRQIEGLRHSDTADAARQVYEWRFFNAAREDGVRELWVEAIIRNHERSVLFVPPLDRWAIKRGIAPAYAKPAGEIGVKKIAVGVLEKVAAALGSVGHVPAWPEYRRYDLEAISLGSEDGPPDEAGGPSLVNRKIPADPCANTGQVSRRIVEYISIERQRQGSGSPAHGLDQREGEPRCRVPTTPPLRRRAG